MASPQCEHGYTKVANELLEAMAKYRFPGQEYQIMLAVMRKTYGYNKKADQISYNQLSEMTGVNRRKVISLVQSLVSKKALGSAQNGTRKPLTIWINKNFEEWLPSAQKGTSAQKDTKTSAQKGDRPSAQKGHPQKKGKKGKIPSTFFDMSKNFLEYQQQQLGEKLVKVTDKKIQDGAEVIEKLTRLDGYDLDEDIRPALAWAVHDDFWSKQVRSLASLRKYGNNGEMKFVNLLSQYYKRNGNKPNQNKQSAYY